MKFWRIALLSLAVAQVAAYSLGVALMPRGGDPVLFETAGSDLECAKLDAPWLNGNIHPAITWKWSETAEPMMADRMAQSILRVLKENGVEKERIGIDVYDPVADSWSSAPSLAIARADLAAALGKDGRIYAIGGGVGSRCLTSPCNVVEAYDVRRNTWTAVAPLPDPRWLFAAAVGPDGRIYVLGGDGAIMSPSPPSTVVDAYTEVPAGKPIAVLVPVAYQSAVWPCTVLDPTIVFHMNLLE